MKTVKSSLLACLMIVAFAFASSAISPQDKKTGEQKNPPKQAENENKQKRLPCEYVCVKWNDNGSCAREELRCP